MISKSSPTIGYSTCTYEGDNYILQSIRPGVKEIKYTTLERRNYLYKTWDWDRYIHTYVSRLLSHVYLTKKISLLWFYLLWTPVTSADSEQQNPIAKIKIWWDRYLDCTELLLSKMFGNIERIMTQQSIQKKQCSYQLAFKYIHRTNSQRKVIVTNARCCSFPNLFGKRCKINR